MDKTDIELLKRVLGPERYCYDYSGRWRYVALKPEEHKQLLNALGLEMPASKFDPQVKRRKVRKDKKPGKAETELDV